MKKYIKSDSRLDRLRKSGYTMDEIVKMFADETGYDIKRQEINTPYAKKRLKAFHEWVDEYFPAKKRD